jgi:putative membrane protein
MKHFLKGIVIALTVLVTACTSSENDSVKQAHEQNLNSAIDKDISKFMTEAADARMMDIEEGRLAAEKGTRAEIKQYGQLMVQDQTKMLKELRMLAASKNMVLPNTLSNEKADGLADLREKTGEEFDKKFVKMITGDHKRDVDDFDDATGFNDKDVRKFAERYLPLVQSHLDKIREIKEKTN